MHELVDIGMSRAFRNDRKRPCIQVRDALETCD